MTLVFVLSIISFRWLDFEPIPFQSLPMTKLLPLFFLGVSLFAQNPPYDVFPDAEPPYYRIRYEASKDPKGLQFPVKFTIWIPEDIKTCLLYTSPSPRDRSLSRMPSSA